jgi:5'-3' exonuclease
MDIHVIDGTYELFRYFYAVLVWPMTEFEADDALASAAAKAARDDRVRQVIICTPDKDLSQCVVGSRVASRPSVRGQVCLNESRNLLP